MSKHRGHNQHEVEDIGDVVSDFSNLPDGIIHHILSLMPTKEAVKTSILSKRWKNLWAFVPNIDFDDKVLLARVVNGWGRPDVTSFMNFVERAFRLRGASSIKKFRLSCSGSYEESKIHSWISYAIMHNVQELDIRLREVDPPMIPWSVLDRTSLVSLKIANSFVSELPSCISFPCLKTLCLVDVVFPSDDHAEKLLLSCLVLEELVLTDTWKNLKNIAISSSTLKSLTIYDWSFLDTLDYSGGCKINIDAANLTYFEYMGCLLLNEMILNNASSLDKALISTFNHEEGEKVAACRAIDLLKQLQYVVSLRVTNDTMESLMFADNMRARFPMFENLSHLTLTRAMRTKTFEAMIDFLYLCPNLQSICLYQGFEDCMHLSENDPIWLLLPTCVSNCLTTVTLENFHAYDSEVCFLKCILKYACVLERMDIWWSPSFTELQDVKRKTEVRTEFETTERSSIACVVKFYEIS